MAAAAAGDGTDDGAIDGFGCAGVARASTFVAVGRGVAVAEAEAVERASDRD